MGRVIKIDLKKRKEPLTNNTPVSKLIRSVNDMQEILQMIEDNIDQKNNNAKKNISG